MKRAPLIEDDGLAGRDRHDGADGRARLWCGWGSWDRLGRGRVQICCKGAPGRDRPREEARNINDSPPALRLDPGLCNRFGQTAPPRPPGRDGPESDGDRHGRSDRLAGPAPPRAPKRALRTRKCSSNRRSRVQNAPLESEMHISTSRGPAITSWASAAPAPPRSISGDPTRRGAAILISSEAVARRSGSARSWAGADPSPACAMRAQRNEIRLGSHHASSARQNPPALNPREPAAHHAIPGDITKTTPPGAGAGRGRREGAGALTPPGRA